MLELLRPHWVAMSFGIVLLGGATALILAQPLVAGRLVDGAASGSPDTATGVLLVLMLIAQLSLEALAHFGLDRTGERLVLRSRTVFGEHVVRLPIGVLDTARSGALLARGASDTGLLRDLPRAVGDLVFAVATLLGAGLFMLSIDALTVGVVVAVMVLAFAAGHPFLARIQRASVDRQAAVGDYTAGLDRALGAARTIKLFGAEDRELASIGREAGVAYSSGVRVASATAANALLIRLGVTGAFVAIMIIDGRRVAGGELSVGDFVSLLAFAVYAIFPITAGFTALATVRIAAGAHDHLTDTLRRLPEGEVRSATVPTASAFREPSSALVEFDRVAFSHGDRPVLTDVSFALGSNQVTALVGPSGAGKSTILALLCRFHDPSAGTLRWAGQDVRELPLREFRAHLGLLEQDAPVLHGTVRDNLLIADPDADDAALWRALEAARIADEIAALPAGLDGPVTERGRSLSGGQRQRLALARALLSRSELILMDEPTAHLDRANEHDVMAKLLGARGTRSLLVVTHRLSTVTAADQILVLEHGRIEASGTHAELLSVPVYRDLVDHELVGD